MKNCLTLFEEQFCQLVALGKTAREAYSETFAVAITDHKSRSRVDNRASRLMKRADILSRISEAAGEQKRRNKEKWEDRGEELAELIYENILSAEKDGRMLSANALRGVEVLAKLKGLNAPDETVLKNGGMAEDFVPRGIEAMSDADLKAIIEIEDKPSASTDAPDVDAPGDAASTDAPDSGEQFPEDKQ